MSRTWAGAIEVPQSNEEFFVPPEEVSLEGVWMGFPNSADIWEGNWLLPRVQKDWGLLVRTIAKYQKVYVICGDFEQAARTTVGKTATAVDYIPSIALNDMWLRDTGCIFRRNDKGNLQGVKLNFNGWGGQQVSHLDTSVADGICDYLNIPMVTADVVGEGGGVVQDGDGTLIANWSSWTGHNRNPGMTKADVAKELLRVYNAEKLIWCDGIIGSDITDAHIDWACNFVRPGEIVMHRPPAKATDPWSVNAKKIYSALKAETDARGRKFKFYFLDEPISPRSKEPDLLNTYVNYLVLDKAVISVNFGDSDADAKAFDVFTTMYVDKKIEMLNLDHIYGFAGGGIHCMTQQQPRTLTTQT